MANFNIAYNLTENFEGGYVNNPKDPGQETFRGISRFHHPSWEGWAIIELAKKSNGFPENLENDKFRSMLEMKVQRFYRRNFWDRISGDHICVQSVANELFDTAVNVGVTVSAKIFQRCLNVLNRAETLYKNLKVDGKIGPKTISALYDLPHQDKYTLLLFMNVLQGARIVKKAEENENMEMFIRGLAKRVQLTLTKSR